VKRDLSASGGQSRIESFVEKLVDTSIGYCIAIISQTLIFPLFDIHVTLRQNFAIAAAFMVVSLVRGYAVRRYFNTYVRAHKQALTQWLQKHLERRRA
jgi:hypothetical protein